MKHTPPTRPLLLPLVPLYRLGLVLRERKFRLGSPVIRRLRWPVISVGNLSTGGSGKTPLTIALARALAARGLHVDALSRGYGRNSTLPSLVDPSATAEQFGDEPLEIARTANIPVFVAAERYHAGLLAEETEPQGVHLLDDGFQHRQLYRDIDILLLSRRDLADRLLPAGNLREPLHAAARADVVAIPADDPELEALIRSRGGRPEIWHLNRCMEIPPIDGPVAAFCGIARPDQFFTGLERAGIKLAARFVFRDHHSYTKPDLDRIASQAQRAAASALVTTEKDRLRLDRLITALPATLPLHTVGLRIEIDNQHFAIDGLIDRLRGPR